MGLAKNKLFDKYFDKQKKRKKLMRTKNIGE